MITLRALAVFVVIIVIGVAVAYSRLSDYHLQLRYNPDSSVITEYIEPESIIHNKWTSMEYTEYQNGEIQSSTLFQRRFNPNYTITHSENGETKKIVGSNGDTSWPSDYLGDDHYTNLYIRTMYSTDLLNRIDMVYINSETAYGVLNQQLNCIKLEYLERSEVVSRKYLVKNGRTEDEEVIRSRGYDLSNKKSLDGKNGMLIGICCPTRNINTTGIRKLFLNIWQTVLRPEPVCRNTLSEI